MKGLVQTRSSGTVALAIAVIVALAPVTAIGDSREFAWFLATLLVLGAFVVAGVAVGGRFAGVLIDDRFKFSLSRLQIVWWTVLVLSAYLGAVWVNMQASARDPLAIEIPEELWVLLGISTASLVGSPLLKGQKRTGIQLEMTPAQLRGEPRTLASNAEAVHPGEVGSASESVAPSAVNTPPPVRPQVTPPSTEEQTVHSFRDGPIVVFDSASSASWSDIFAGEEVSNWRTVDIAKVQLFIITLVAGVTYAYAIFELFQRGGAIKALPEVSDGMNALLGISHAGYLTHKALPLTPKQ